MLPVIYTMFQSVKLYSEKLHLIIYHLITSTEATIMDNLFRHILSVIMRSDNEARRYTVYK